jgi:hypothetical protein
MATLHDYGKTPTDTLAAPPLGGAGGWCAAVEAELVRLAGRRVQSGGGVTVASWTVVPFPTPFPTTPNVVVSMHENGAGMIQTRNITAAGFEVAAYDLLLGAPGTAVAGINFQWMAVG